MLTVKELLRVMEIEYSLRSFGGTCFGVIDSSRLRPVGSMSLLKVVPACESCKAGIHECTGKAIVHTIHMKETTEYGDRRMIPKFTNSETCCRCYRCHVVADHPESDVPDPEPF